ITVQPASGATALVTLEGVEVSNYGDGIFAGASSGAGPVLVTIADSIVSNNTANGFAAISQGGAVLMQINQSTASQNNGAGVSVDGSQAQIILGDSLVAQNATGISVSNGAKIYSYQNNQINGNTSDGTPIPPIALH